MTDKTQNEMEAAVIQALELQREPAVPADFAARVMRSLPPQPAARPRVRVSRTVGIVAAAILTIAVFALAPHAAPSFTSLTFDLELMLLAELAGIACWLGSRPGTSSSF
jgi:hypothetical protein